MGGIRSSSYLLISIQLEKCLIICESAVCTSCGEDYKKFHLFMINIYWANARQNMTKPLALSVKVASVQNFFLL